MNLGAVSYLNMLPYFFDDPGVTTLPSPRELNVLAKEDAFDAACLSAIAGLRAGFSPISPFFGIGSRGPVASVYLEPIFAQQDINKSNYTDGVTEFWIDFVNGNKNRLHELDLKSPPPRVVRLVHLLTVGASEHSEWLIRVLLAAQGFATEVHRVPESWHALSPRQLAAHVQMAELQGPCAMLVIGDPALQRAAMYRDVGTPRLDLGALWEDFSAGLPCLFAIWYQTRTSRSELLAHGSDQCGFQNEVQDEVQNGIPVSQPVSHNLGRHLADTLARWNALSDDAKWHYAADLLKKRRPLLSESQKSCDDPDRQAYEGPSREGTLAYLANIAFAFDTEFDQTFAWYQKLFLCFEPALRQTPPLQFNPLPRQVLLKSQRNLAAL